MASLSDMMRASAGLITSSADGTDLSRIFSEEPVPLDTFVRDKRFLGNPPLSAVQYEAVRYTERIYYPELYPLMAKEFNDTYWTDITRMVNFVTLQWGKGGGKDHICRIASMRVAYLLMCLISPQEYYGIPEQDTIHLLNVASSSTQAQQAFFTPITRAVKSGWFKDRCDPHINTISYAKNIECISGHSDAETQEGLNLMLGIADEVDAFKSKGEIVVRRIRSAREPTKSVENILDMIRTSGSTRFPQVFKNVRISYPRYLGSMIQQLTRTAREDLKKKGEASRHYLSGPLATWEVNPRVTGKDMFADDYETDPVMARSKYECKPSRAVNPYFRNHDAVDAVFLDVPPPIKVSYRREHEAWIPSYTFRPDFKPIVGAVYAMHADMAISGDKAGIAMAHVQKYEQYEKILAGPEGEDVPFLDRRPVIKVDFVLAYEADISLKPAREIQIRWARQLAFELVQRGFTIKQMSYDGFQCLSGDTRIPLLDGTTKIMKELVGSEPFWVYSINERGHVVPGLCTKAWKTDTRDDMLEIVLDNGESVTATSDHRFMLRDGSYRMARDLRVDDSLMPLYRRLKKLSSTSALYEQVYHPEPTGNGQHWRFTHSMVSHDRYGLLPKGWVTHHIDCNPRNNAPANLRQMASGDHSMLHQELARVNPFAESWKDPEWAAAHRTRIADAQREILTGKFGRDAKHYRHDLSFEDVLRTSNEILEAGEKLGHREVAAQLGCSQDVLYSRVREAGYGSWVEFKRTLKPQSSNALAQARRRERHRAALGPEKYNQLYNHKVVAVRPAAPTDVYDLRVEKYHNFAVDAGVFVHNSADSMQILRSRGIDAKKVSTDANIEPYRNLRDVMYEGRLATPQNPPLREELLSLTKLVNGKLDHPSSSSKDLADAFACAAQGAVEVGGEEDPAQREAYFGNVTFEVGPAIGSLAGVPRDMEGGSPLQGSEHMRWQQFLGPS